MSEQQDNGWQIYVEDTLIGVAYFHHSDQPWFICTFQPTSAYETYRHIFDEYATLVNNPSPEQAKIDIGEYYETNIQSLNLKLVSFGDVWSGRIDVAQIYDGNEAWLRPW